MQIATELTAQAVIARPTGRVDYEPRPAFKKNSRHWLPRPRARSFGWW